MQEVLSVVSLAVSFYEQNYVALLETWSQTVNKDQNDFHTYPLHYYVDQETFASV